MKKFCRQFNATADPSTIGRKSEYSDSEPIPVDLIYEVLSKLPAKSVARFRCVSQLWGSMLSCKYFTDLFLTRSSGRPQLLFTCVKDNELFFFSTPQTRGNWFPVAATYHMKYPCARFINYLSHISGLVCFKDRRGKKNGLLATVVCSPSTGQSFTIPKMKTRRRIALSSYLGYDPIHKQFKVLAMTLPDGISEEHQVLTLGGAGSPWKMIECSIPHCPGYQVICINGVLYYPAKVNMSSPFSMIVCFDVRNEKYSFIKVTEAFIDHTSTLINYNGKLASLTTPRRDRISGTTGAFVMCVLEDPQKHEWSKQIYLLPPQWEGLVGEATLHIVGITRTNEIVLSGKFPNDPFYVFYYNLEWRTIGRVQIHGMGAFKGNNVFTFIEHVEDLNLMQVF